MSIRLYVGNLPAELDRQALEKIFHESGESVSLKVITDRKTGRCRGFGFVTVGSDELADTVIEKFNGFDFNGTVLKLEKALPRNKGKAGEEDGEEGTATEATGTSETTTATPTPRAAKQRSNSNKSSKQRSGGNRSSSQSSGGGSSEAHQPDPRWAQELEVLKQKLLEAQAAK
jgi:RNA recognition motif-containing protein